MTLPQVYINSLESVVSGFVLSAIAKKDFFVLYVDVRYEKVYINFFCSIMIEFIQRSTIEMTLNGLHKKDVHQFLCFIIVKKIILKSIMTLISNKV